MSSSSATRATASGRTRSTSGRKQFRTTSRLSESASRSELQQSPPGFLERFGLLREHEPHLAAAQFARAEETAARHGGDADLGDEVLADERHVILPSKQPAIRHDVVSALHRVKLKPG